ncbi:helix-turn-helix domain-containing protein [Streptomyces sp. NPDC049040]|uniref:helix-turn-helix domain-containing protein n=1 Tax=Streptomyces sp. NPDC049040 TaxID=3365593 RepID=UPI003710E333
MLGGAGGRETEDFATLLRELKDRSGLSYGALAKRLHMSTSTLHRYCNGTAVPSDYAPVERLCRVCRATPQELVEVHRRWILADAARKPREDRAAATRLKAAASDVAGAEAVAEAVAEPVAEPAVEPVAEPAVEPVAEPAVQPVAEAVAKTAAEAAPAQDSPQGAGSTDPTPPEDEPVVERMPRAPASPRRRRSMVAGSAAMAAVVVAAVLVAHPWRGGAGDGAGDQQVAGATASSGTSGTGEASGTGKPSATASSAAPSTSAPGRTPSAPASATGSPRSGHPASAGATGGSGTDAAPLTVHTRPYVFETICGQRFLVDSAPEQVGPPPNEEDAPRWAEANGAVASDSERIAITVQGTGAHTVVLEGLHVGIVSRNAPLAWNEYESTECGGKVATQSFDVDLDRGIPTATVKNSSRAFPYKVTESDPEVFYVTVHTKAHDVRWNFTLDWSSGDRHGTLVVDNDGTPFRLSADVDRPDYDCLPGCDEWTLMPH